MTPVTASHIWLDDRGVAWIDDTSIKVIEVAKERRGGASPEQIVQDHPGCYTLAQVYAALAYYMDQVAVSSTAGSKWSRNGMGELQFL